MNPKNFRECYSHLSTKLDVEKQFEKKEGKFRIIDEDDLFRNVVLDEKFGEGGNNFVYNAVGTNICTIKSKRNIQKHPLLYRQSKYSLDMDSRDINDIIEDYKNEMIMQVDLSSKGIMPFIYTCGLLKSGWDVYTFSIMEKFGNSVKNILQDTTKIDVMEKVIQGVLNLYDTLGNKKICNVDVKPENVVVSLKDNNEIDRIALIDVAYDFNIKVDTKELAKDIMKVTFLLYTKRNFYYDYLKDIIDNELDKISKKRVDNVIIVFEKDPDMELIYKHYDLGKLIYDLYNNKSSPVSKKSSISHTSSATPSTIINIDSVADNETSLGKSSRKHTLTRKRPTSWSNESKKNKKLRSSLR